MTPLAEREHLLSLFNEAIEQGVSKTKAADVMDLELRTLQRWQRPETARADGRTQRRQAPGNQLSAEERARVLAVANADEFKDKTVRSNSSKSSGLKSRPRNCPYALVV